jgi:hypothetical protein
MTAPIAREAFEEPTSQDSSKFRATVGIATKQPELENLAIACLKELTAACFNAADEFGPM